MGEFDQGDVDHCRASYWSARADWHKILMDCYDETLRRRERDKKPGFSGAKVARTSA